MIYHKSEQLWAAPSVTDFLQTFLINRNHEFILIRNLIRNLAEKINYVDQTIPERFDENKVKLAALKLATLPQQLRIKAIGKLNETYHANVKLVSYQ